MDWLHGVLIAVVAVLLMLTWHFYDYWCAAEDRAVYWSGMYEQERVKYRRLVGSLVSQGRAKERAPVNDPMVGGSR